MAGRDIFLPMMAIIVFVAVVVHLAQSGFSWSVEPLALKASKINPIEGAEKMFSKRAPVELRKSVMKILILARAAFTVFRGNLGNLLQLPYQDKGETITSGARQTPGTEIV